MFTEQQISRNLVEELRTEAGQRHGDGAEESLEWRAADRLLEAQVILQTLVNLSADMSADPLPKPLREIQDDEQALLIRAQEWCRRMGPVTVEDAARFRWESHDWSPDTNTCRRCGAGISTTEACPLTWLEEPGEVSPAAWADLKRETVSLSAWGDYIRNYHVRVEREVEELRQPSFGANDDYDERKARLKALLQVQAFLAPIVRALD
jgi:hypothetical protein